MGTGACKGQKRASDPLEREWQVVGSYLIRMLRKKCFGSPVRAANTFNSCAFSQLLLTESHVSVTSVSSCFVWAWGRDSLPCISVSADSFIHIWLHLITVMSSHDRLYSAYATIIKFWRKKIVPLYKYSTFRV